MSFDCPSCGSCYDTKRGMKVHHSKVHGESISGELINCTWCDDTFRKYESDIESDENHFCCRDCQTSWQSKNWCGENSPRSTLKPVDCDVCGDEVLRPKWQREKNDTFLCSDKCRAVKMKQVNTEGDSSGFDYSCTNCREIFTRSGRIEGDNKFCSNECQSEYFTGEHNPSWKEPEETECVECGDTFIIEKVKGYYKRVTCSNNCKDSLISEKLSGEDNPNWKGGYGNYYGSEWSDARDKIRLKDDNTCQMCGFTTDERFIPVHHIIPVSEFMTDPNDAHYEANLVQVCRSCHPTVEAMPPVEQVDALGVERVQEVMKDV